MFNKLILIVISLVVSLDVLSQCKDSSGDMDFEINGTGNVVVTYTEINNCFEILQSDLKSKYFSIKGLKDIRNVALDLTVELSYKGDYLLIGFNVGESSRVYQLYNSFSAELVKEFFASFAGWLGSESEVIYIPDFGGDELQSQGGLNLYLPDSKSSLRLFKEYLFYGNFKASNRIVIGKVLQEISSKFTLKLVRLDLIDEKIEFI